MDLSFSKWSLWTCATVIRMACRGLEPSQHSGRIRDKHQRLVLDRNCVSLRHTHSFSPEDLEYIRETLAAWDANILDSMRCYYSSRFHLLAPSVVEPLVTGPSYLTESPQRISSRHRPVFSTKGIVPACSHNHVAISTLIYRYACIPS